MGLIDFSNCQKLNKAYDGANGSKISIRYKDSVYMLKFPSYAKLNDRMHYTNGILSEYIGCHIFQLLGISAQETELGIYHTNRGYKPVVACKDFTYTENGHVLAIQDFASLKNQMIDSIHHGYGTELSDILDTISHQTIMDADALEQYFWNIFVIDEWIANPDRHNGNWGFLYDSFQDNLKIAPIYDCGSSLYPQADFEIMQNCLKDEQERNIRVYGRITSAIMIHGKRIRWNDFNNNLLEVFPGYRQALRRMLPLIEEKEQDVIDMIQATPEISSLQSAFLTVMLEERKQKLLFPAYKKSLGLPYTDGPSPISKAEDDFKEMRSHIPQRGEIAMGRNKKTVPVKQSKGQTLNQQMSIQNESVYHREDRQESLDGMTDEAKMQHHRDHMAELEQEQALDPVTLDRGDPYRNVRDDDQNGQYDYMEDKGR